MSKVQTSYLIAEIVMIPLSGWLSRLLSTRVLFTISAVGFTIFSFACAFAILNAMWLEIHETDSGVARRAKK